MGSLNGESLHELEGGSRFSPEKETQNWRASSKEIWRNVCKSIKTVVLSNKLNLLIPFGPLAILVKELTGHHAWVILLSLFGIAPLAGCLGYAKEQLAFHSGPIVNVLLNDTIGNATELVISILALKSGLKRVVQLSLFSSILLNMLLVLGCAFFFGGLFRHKEQRFSKETAIVKSVLLLMAIMGLFLTAVLHYTHTEIHTGQSELALSRFSSCIMLAAYVAYLFFQLKSHWKIHERLDKEVSQTEEGPEDDEIPEISKWESIIWFLILTAWIYILSGYLVHAIEGASIARDMPIEFISVILLPLVGNVAELTSAIGFAMKDKLDSSLGVAIGTSTHILLFRCPFLVFTSWMMGQRMDLDFQLFETATVLITVLFVTFMLKEGTSNYFKGLMLILSYLIVAASVYVHVDPT